MNTIKKLLLAFATAALLCTQAWALDLQAAKNQGLVGEQANGYLGSPQASPSAEVKALIADINAKRKEQYQSIASKQGVALGTVEKLAGEKTFDKTAAGHYIKPAGANWQKK